MKSTILILLFLGAAANASSDKLSPEARENLQKLKDGTLKIEVPKIDPGCTIEVPGVAPCKLEAPIKKTEVESSNDGELYAQLPGGQRLMPSLDELRTMDPKLIEQLRRLQLEQNKKSLPQKVGLEETDSQLQVSANNPLPQVIQIPRPAVKAKDMQEMLRQLREAPASGPKFEIPEKKAEVESADASA